MKQFYRLAALFLALLLLCGCAAGNGYGKPERKEGQDQYLTDPVPEGKPQPVEPQDVTVSDTEYTCTISISCASILEHMDLCDKEKVELVPENGWLLKPVEVTFKQGQSVFDVLQQVCRDNKIHMEFSMTPIYNSAYIEGIGNLYEFDCGEVSGWMYIGFPTTDAAAISFKTAMSWNGNTPASWARILAAGTRQGVKHEKQRYLFRLSSDDQFPILCAGAALFDVSHAPGLSGNFPDRCAGV